MELPDDGFVLPNLFAFLDDPLVDFGGGGGGERGLGIRTGFVTTAGSPAQRDFLGRLAA